jgi:hypothetical protein
MLQGPSERVRLHEVVRFDLDSVLGVTPRLQQALDAVAGDTCLLDPPQFRRSRYPRRAAAATGTASLYRENQRDFVRRYLIVVRADHDSRHPDWLRGSTERNFDLFVSYFGEEPNSFHEHADIYEAHPGMKWPRLYELFRGRRDWFLSYDACCFADDDLSSNARTLNAMFDLFAEFQLWMAQPALGPGSSVSVPLTAQVRAARLRFTNYVDVMCPIFSKATLARVAPTFNQSVSGWGLDYLWPKLLEFPVDRIAVLDATPVVHTRRWGTGRNYRVCETLGVSPQAELDRIVSEHALDVNRVTYSRVPLAFRARDAQKAMAIAPASPSSLAESPRRLRNDRSRLPVQPGERNERSFRVSFEDETRPSSMPTRLLRVYLALARGEAPLRHEPAFRTLPDRGQPDTLIGVVQRRGSEWKRRHYVGVFSASAWARTGLTSGDLSKALDAAGFRHDVYAIASGERTSISRRLAKLHPSGEFVARTLLCGRLRLPERILGREVLMIDDNLWLARPELLEKLVRDWLVPAREAFSVGVDAGIRSALLDVLASAFFSHSACRVGFFGPGRVSRGAGA